MKIIISPAKKMQEQPFWPGENTDPVFWREADRIRSILSGYDRQGLKTLFGANDKITEENYIRYQQMDLKKAVTPALLSYIGLQYQSMAPQVFTEDQWEYGAEHVRILSGFYGILRPTDKILPYRLEMQAKLSVEGKGDLYGFWGSRIYEELTKDDHVIVNLASKEYSKVIEPFVGPEDRLVTCVFAQEVTDLPGEKGKKWKVKATAAKIARGDMVRFMAEKKVERVEELQTYRGLGYEFESQLSDENHYVFVLRQNK